MANSVAMWLEKIGLQSLSPIFEIKVIASYSKMQEAHLYAKFKGEIYFYNLFIFLVVVAKWGTFRSKFWWCWVDLFSIGRGV